MKEIGDNDSIWMDPDHVKTAQGKFVSGLPAFSDSSGTLQKCHHMRGASYCVTVSILYNLCCIQTLLLNEGPIEWIGVSEKCHCKRGASYRVTVTGVTVSREPYTLTCFTFWAFAPVISEQQLLITNFLSFRVKHKCEISHLLMISRCEHWQCIHDLVHSACKVHGFPPSGVLSPPSCTFFPQMSIQ